MFCIHYYIAAQPDDDDDDDQKSANEEHESHYDDSIQEYESITMLDGEGEYSNLDDTMASRGGEENGGHIRSVPSGSDQENEAYQEHISIMAKKKKQIKETSIMVRKMKQIKDTSIMVRKMKQIKDTS